MNLNFEFELIYPNKVKVTQEEILYKVLPYELQRQTIHKKHRLRKIKYIIIENKF